MEAINDSSVSMKEDAEDIVPLSHPFMLDDDQVTSSGPPKFTFIDLFAGVGGFHYAMHAVGGKCVFASENDRHARATYELNHRKSSPELFVNGRFNREIKEVVLDDIPPFDVLCAGFPCQPFSVAGHGLGFDDDRGKVFFEITRILAECRPKAYLLENVKTLITHNNGESFSRVRTELGKTGYSFIPFVLNAAEHTDIPQGRERIYIVGFRDEPEFSYLKPTDVNYLESHLQAPVSTSFKIPAKTEKPRKNFRDFLDDSTVADSDYYSRSDSVIDERVRSAVTNRDKIYQYRRWYVRENKSNVCPTLTANMGLGGHNIPIILDNGIPRRLTPKECFNLQGFPPEFLLADDVPRGHLYRQAGNSVVVPLVSRIAKEMVRVLDENGNS